MALFLNSYPHSVEGAKLELTQEQEQFCKVVYKLDGKGVAFFEDLWYPEQEYSDEYAVIPLRSVYDGTEPFAAGTCFANVIGSTEDPHPRVEDKNGKIIHDWIDLWIDKAKGVYNPVGCCTDGKFYYLYRGQQKEFRRIKYLKGESDAVCQGKLIGGHVIMNATNATSVGTGGNVYILPICNKHNIGGNWGAGFYMRLVCDTTAVRLTNYMQRVNDYIG